MRNLRASWSLVAVLCGALVLAACGAGGTSSTGSAPTPKPTVVKAKPTGVPTITVPFCQGILTVAEANQIMQPATPATNIRIDSSPAGGSCNYEYAQFKSVVSILFLPYHGPTPVTAQGFQALVVNLASQGGATITTQAIVSGVGDQATFLAVTGHADSLTIKQDTLYVLDGSVLMAFGNFAPGSSPDATQQGYLTQVGQLVVSRL